MEQLNDKEKEFIIEVLTKITGNYQNVDALMMARQIVTKMQGKPASPKEEKK